MPATKLKTLILLCCATLLVLSTGYVVYARLSENSNTAPQSELDKPTSFSMTVADRAVVGHHTYLSEYKVPITKDTAFEIEVTTETTASEIQIGFDPSFTSSNWQKLRSSMVVSSNHTGYQQIFARTRQSPGTQPSTPGVIDVIIDPSWSTSPIRAVQRFGSHGVVATIVSEAGSGLGAEIASTIESGWTVVGSQTKATLVPSESSALSRGHGIKADGTRYHSGARFDVVLLFDTPIPNDQLHTLTNTDDQIGSHQFTFVANESTSPLVQTNQLGWAPSDSKHAFLGGWHQPIPRVLTNTQHEFNVVDESGTPVLTGVSTLRPGTGFGGDRFTNSPVWELDFSDVTQPGKYRICVESIGCSHQFRIHAAVWAEAATAVARAAYHQRSGQSFGPSYTPIRRPRPRHPDDGLRVRSTEVTHLEAEAELLERRFEKIVAGDNGELDPNLYWGGHHDAGDWDRRIQHLWYARSALDVVRVNPAFVDRSLNIDESDNSISDFIDEGLWTLDLFQRSQRSDGAISGGIEATAHPREGDGSWTSELTLYAYSPDAWSSLIYSSVAAEYATYLADIDPNRAALLLDSALDATQWALEHRVNRSAKQSKLIEEQIPVAAIALLEATGDPKWSELFDSSNPFSQPTEALNCHSRHLCDLARMYLRLPPTLSDPSVVDAIRESAVRSADLSLAASQQTAYGWALENPYVPLVWGLGVGGAPNARGLLLAYEITGDRRYHDGALRSAGVSLGANPIGISYVTGLGTDSVRYPLVVDSINLGLPSWPGTPVYGNHRLSPDDSWLFEHKLQPAGVSDDPQQLPYMWQFADVMFPPFTEYTLHQSHAPALFVFASLDRYSHSESP